MTKEFRLYCTLGINQKNKLKGFFGIFYHSIIFKIFSIFFLFCEKTALPIATPVANIFGLNLSPLNLGTVQYPKIFK